MPSAAAVAGMREVLVLEVVAWEVALMLALMCILASELAREATPEEWIPPKEGAATNTVIFVHKVSGQMKNGNKDKGRDEHLNHAHLIMV